MEVGMKGVVVVVVVVGVGVVVCEREGGGMEVRIDGGREKCSVGANLLKDRKGPIPNNGQGCCKTGW